MEEWEAGQKRIKKWLAASSEGPSPSGMKRCMNCYVTMSYDDYCECLKDVGRSIRAKAQKACAPLAPKPEKPKQTKKKDSNQERLF